MNNFEPDQKEFEDEWQSIAPYEAAPVKLDDVSDDENYVDMQPEQSEKREKRRLTGSQRIIKYQLIICALAVILITALKFTNSGLFHTVRDWYCRQLNSELVITDFFDFHSGENNEN